MADSKSGIGGFRTQIGGFNKEDVIAYINELQESHARELERSRQETRRRRWMRRTPLCGASTPSCGRGRRSRKTCRPSSTSNTPSTGSCGIRWQP